jgi:hypothetical protein
MASDQESSVDWRTVADEFKRDGALRDIYVHDVALADWQAALDNIRVRYAPLKFSVDGELADLPDEVTEIFRIRERGSLLLNFDLGAPYVACHFFTEEQIEFNLRPEDVTGPERLAAVVSFMHGLTTAIGKAVVLTMENMPNAVILRADPTSGRVVRVPFSDATAG